jgi:hypothetical protein
VTAKEETDVDSRHYFILMGVIITGLIFVYSWGISGNDFWWHVKAGEWMVNNRDLPAIDVFSWYAKENSLIWSSHEWLSQVLFYVVHNLGGDIGIFLLSLASAILMAVLIVRRNQQAIQKNIALATIYLVPMVILFRLMCYGRPQLISYFLIYATLHCLYSYQQDQSSRAVYCMPLIALLWGNFHAGSSTLSYILCFLFMFSGLFEFSIGKLHVKKYTRRKLLTYLAAGVLSIAALAINPYGLKMLIYPYANMGDSFMQEMINEWSAPDAKKLSHLILFYWPLLIVGVSLIVTDKKIKAVDLLVFLFFAYMLFRSVRFGVVYYIASTFFAFDYFPEREAKPVGSRIDALIFKTVLLLLLVINLFSSAKTFETWRAGQLISVILDKKFVELLKAEAPKRLFNDYNFGEALIYNGIQTFSDARADLFSAHNLRDTRSLSNLVQYDESEMNKIFDPEQIISRYDFDAFLVGLNKSLAVYLRSRPQDYQILMQFDNAVYFKRLKCNASSGAK